MYEISSVKTAMFIGIAIGSGIAICMCSMNTMDY